MPVPYLQQVLMVDNNFTGIVIRADLPCTGVSNCVTCRTSPGLQSTPWTVPKTAYYKIRVRGVVEPVKYLYGCQQGLWLRKTVNGIDPSGQVPIPGNTYSMNIADSPVSPPGPAIFLFNSPLDPDSEAISYQDVYPIDFAFLYRLTENQVVRIRSDSIEGLQNHNNFPGQACAPFPSPKHVSDIPAYNGQFMQLDFQEYNGNFDDRFDCALCPSGDIDDPAP